MKLIKRMLAAVILLGILVATTGCYVTSAQSMRRLKGTYKLTAYSYTPSYERREGYTPKTTDYVNDAEHLYEDYLVITGESRGYYVHKDASGEAYVKEITLTYTADSEESDKIQYVTFNDALIAEGDAEFNKLGVNRNGLNYSKPSFDYTELFTKRKMRSEHITVRWERVDRATDISYATEQIGEYKSYSYEGYGIRGIYELYATMDQATDTVVENEYLYFYFVIDPATSAERAAVCYATKDAPSEQIRREVSLSTDSGSITIDGTVFSLEPQYGTYYSAAADGIESRIHRISSDITEATLNSLVADKLPAE